MYKFPMTGRRLLSGTSGTLVNELSRLGLFGRLERWDPEVVQTVLAGLKSAFTVDFMDEELDKLKTQSLKAEQRRAADDSRDPHVVVAVSMTTTTTTSHCSASLKPSCK